MMLRDFRFFPELSETEKTMPSSYVYGLGIAELNFVGDCHVSLIEFA